MAGATGCMTGAAVASSAKKSSNLAKGAASAEGPAKPNGPESGARSPPADDLRSCGSSGETVESTRPE